jgi:uncharacterized protein YndB with AHSA1/START domain
MADARTSARGFTETRWFNAPRELVFQAWTDPRHLGWFFNPSMPEPSVPIEVDLRVGGAWRQRMVVDEATEYTTGGIYREIVPVERLVFTWGAVNGWPELGGSAADDAPVVTLQFTELDGGTEMVFTVTLPEHLDSDQVREWLGTGMREGWSVTLERLSRHGTFRSTGPAFHAK